MSILLNHFCITQKEIAYKRHIMKKYYLYLYCLHLPKTYPHKIQAILLHKKQTRCKYNSTSYNTIMIFYITIPN